MKNLEILGQKTLVIEELQVLKIITHEKFVENTITSKLRHTDKKFNFHKSYLKFPNYSDIYFLKSTYYIQYLRPALANFRTGLFLLRINKVQKSALKGILGAKRRPFNCVW